MTIVYMSKFDRDHEEEQKNRYIQTCGLMRLQASLVALQQLDHSLMDDSDNLYFAMIL